MAKILVVDDSPEFRKLLEIVLERAGHETVTASDGTEGLAAAAAEQPDLILLDYMMPDMNGREVFRLLRDSDATAHIPVIMITAFVNQYQDDLTAALRLGMDDFLAKPVSPKDLIARVDNLLYLRRTTGPGQM